MLPSICYTVWLHFAETYWEAAGAKNKAVILKFDATADTGGQIAVQFTTGQRPHESTRAIQEMVTHDETLEFTYTRANAAVPQDSYS